MCKKSKSLEVVLVEENDIDDILEITDLILEETEDKDEGEYYELS